MEKYFDVQWLDHPSPIQSVVEIQEVVIQLFGDHQIVEKWSRQYDHHSYN